MDTMTMGETTTSARRAFRPEMADQVGAGTRTPGWDLATERRIDDGKSLAKGLGWFSIGLGLAEVVAPGKLARWLGMEGSEQLLRVYGFREIATGVGILSRREPTEWVWGRVAGDFLDLATLAPGLAHDNPNRKNVVTAMAAVAGVTVLDVLAGKQLSASQR
jgi:hypothetical protein